MSKKVTYTSTLPEDLMLTVNDYSAKYKVSKNKVVEKALRQFFFELKRKEFSEGFKRAAKDPEVVELAEMGMDDYFEMLERYDKEDQ
jgi:ribosomal protein L10